MPKFLQRFINVIFKSPYIYYSSYISFGILLSQFFNIHAYEAKGASVLMTWFANIGITYLLPTVIFVKSICVIITILTFCLLQFIIPKILSLSNDKSVSIFFALSFSLCLISQIIFSSAMRFSYEFSFCLVGFGSLIVYKIFVESNYTEQRQNLRLYQELWDLLKILMPIIISPPLLVGFGGFIASFYPGEIEFIRAQLYRHIAMIAYFEIGIILLLFLQIIRKILSIRNNV